MFDKKSLYAAFFAALLLACLTPLQTVKALDLQLNPDLIIEANPNIILSLYLPSSNGVVRWAFETGGAINSSSPAVGTDGTVYVGSTDGKLYAVDKKGKKKWEFATGAAVYSSPAISADGTVYVGSDVNLYAITPDGKLKWAFEAGGAIYSTAAIGEDGTIYVECEDGKLYALKPDGTKRWEFVTGGGMSGKPAIDSNGTIYVGSRDKKLYAINPNGTKKWEFTTINEVKTSPAIGSDGTVYVASGAERLYAIKRDGTLKWEYPLDKKLYGGNSYSSPTIGADGTIYVGSGDSGIYAIKPDGTKKWKFDTDGIMIASPSIGADGTIYIGSADRKLYAIKPDGTKKWEFRTNGQIVAASAVGPDGAVYIGSGDRKLYAVGMVHVNGVNLNKTALKLDAGQSETLQATIAPSNASYQEITWSSSDDRIAIVDVTGKVTGIGPGTATVTATSEDGGYYKQCVVTVTAAMDDNPPAPANNPPAPETDAAKLADIEGHILGSEIVKAVALGIVYGYPDGTFRPDGNVTRAEFASMIVRGLPPGEEGAPLTFKDKDKIGAWAVKAVRQSVKLGIIHGYEDGTFRPNANITHAEMIAMILRASDLSMDNVTRTGFSDDADIPKWAKPAVFKAEEVGIVNAGDFPDGKFAPQAMSTRAEAASAIVRMLEVRK
ncbi:outer membrane protein assembly factor BamB family protein [Paenibacillus spongiae]|uniref:PQQ-binding-like beta-propeller repeat protein n=1 Tax=Paenibacillus spongiae TaxID=2909671 RepID=A0ABY5S238_9BACL|nr:PQQ-binding-like beta-propeller repeat protein [Paenibacillus spongiae]UVI27724.1 PQQ-binding-like beta-propeller repeat protein [Paenibacillus spongiae]